MNASTTTRYPDQARVERIRSTPRAAGANTEFDLADWLVSVGIRAELRSSSEGVEATLVPQCAGQSIQWRNPAGGFHNPSFRGATADEALARLTEAVLSVDIYLCGRQATLLRKGYYWTQPVVGK